MVTLPGESQVVFRSDPLRQRRRSNPDVSQLELKRGMGLKTGDYEDRLGGCQAANEFADIERKRFKTSE
jgi:hypothetical protein